MWSWFSTPDSIPETKVEEVIPIPPYVEVKPEESVLKVPEPVKWLVPGPGQCVNVITDQDGFIISQNLVTMPEFKTNSSVASICALELRLKKLEDEFDHDDENTKEINDRITKLTHNMQSHEATYIESRLEEITFDNQRFQKIEDRLKLLENHMITEPIYANTGKGKFNKKFPVITKGCML